MSYSTASAAMSPLLQDEEAGRPSPRRPQSALSANIPRRHPYHADDASSITSSAAAQALLTNLSLDDEERRSSAAFSSKFTDTTSILQRHHRRRLMDDTQSITSQQSGKSYANNVPRSQRRRRHFIDGRDNLSHASTSSSSSSSSLPRLDVDDRRSLSAHVRLREIAADEATQSSSTVPASPVSVTAMFPPVAGVSLAPGNTPQSPVDDQQSQQLDAQQLDLNDDYFTSTPTTPYTLAAYLNNNDNLEPYYQSTNTGPLPQLPAMDAIEMLYHDAAAGWDSAVDDDSDDEYSGNDEPATMTPAVSDGQHDWTSAKELPQYFILTSAGKPVYSRHGDDASLATLCGLIQAIISSFASNAHLNVQDAATDQTRDDLRSVSIGKHRRAIFLRRGPLYMAAVAGNRMSAGAIAVHLGYLYEQIASSVTPRNLELVLSQRTNYDLRQLLSGTEGILDFLANRFRSDVSFVLGTAPSLRLEPSLRARITNAMRESRVPSALFMVIFSGMSMIALQRPRDRILHAVDLHILAATIRASSSSHLGESWMPICLPRLDPRNFMHIYVHHITPDLTLSIVSLDKTKFFDMSACKDAVVEKLNRVENGELMKRLKARVAKQVTVVDVGIPGLRHFVYRSRKYCQHIASAVNEPHTTEADCEFAATEYALLRDQIISTASIATTNASTAAAAAMAMTATMASKSKSKTKDVQNASASNPSSPTVSSGANDQRRANGSASSSARPTPILSAYPNAARALKHSPDVKSKSDKAVSATDPSQLALRIVHSTRPTATTLVCATPTVELYCVFNPYLSRAALVNSANKLLQWCQKNESSLFAGDVIF
ncbi:DUF254-domain-containing protein [Ramicandelaber brevisporus]|nr:DUF254-domain-containing protein [Ramicandelaber brevisporus]